MRAEIISVGTELLLGDIVNTNAQFLAQELANLGYGVYYQTVVGDNAVRLRDLIAEAKDRSDVLIFTGGLGPTEDDLTKETVAEAFGDTLIPDAEELVKLEQFFEKRGVVMTENNKKQAMVPRLGRKLPNDNGTAPGAFFRQGSTYAILLPGPPREMQPMFTQQVLPLLESMQDSAIRSVVLRVFGIGESTLEAQIYELLSGSNPTAALYAKTGEVHIRITAKAATAEQAETMCDEYAALFRTALGDMIYSQTGDDLETVAVSKLMAGNTLVATAESCTGGLLGERLTSVPGASAVYGYGAITYANEAKHNMLGVRNSTLRKHGAVSSQVAGEMAFGAAKKGDADFGVAITGIAGPDGGTAKKPVGLVYVAVCDRRCVHVKKLNLGERGRAYVRELACHHALDMLRRVVTGLPLPGAKRFSANQLADFEREGNPRRRGGRGLRAFLALTAALLLVGAIVLGGYAARAGKAKPPAATGQMPSAQGLRYGTPEYTKAAMALVQQQREENPSINGFVAFPGEKVETLVAQTANGKQASLADAAGEPGTDNFPILAADAVPTGQGANPLLLGTDPFSPLLDYQNTAAGGGLSTFTYFTPGEERIYKVVGVLLADPKNLQADRFDPAVRQVSGYSGFLSFLLGAKARSLYELPVDAAEGDAFMTLAVQDPDTPQRYLYLVGRRLRPGENTGTGPATPAGNPLMPTSWYLQQNQQRPDVSALYSWWLRWYLTRDASNSQMQLSAGMPARDAAPMIPAPAVPASSQRAATSSSASSSSASSAAPVSTQGALLLTAAASSDSTSSQSTAESSSASEAIVIRPRPMPQPLPTKPDPGILTVTMNGQRVSDTTHNVLAQITQAEAGGRDANTMRAVAICAHSWILNQQGAGNAAPAVVGSMPTETVLAAVRDVERLILTADESNPAFTPWFAMAAQGTNTALNVWGTARPYLAGAPSPGDAGQEGWSQTVNIPLADFAALVQDRLDITLSAYGPEDRWATAVTRNANGYVDSLEIGGQVISGFALWNRVLVTNGRPLLPSPAFEVEFDGENYRFICYGQGHGCGLSIAGADALAKQGHSYDGILENYFPGCTLITW